MEELGKEQALQRLLKVIKTVQVIKAVHKTHQLLIPSTDAIQVGAGEGKNLEEGAAEVVSTISPQDLHSQDEEEEALQSILPK